ncbi:hypothetical protein DLAC_07985 [Tieghemostelium lacteum]|uniref:Polymerase/histidinol phosphatase N-terminal domain-containing protein n=1 Tax=Tieghemostelium lacteum TaxID=361077 RepID=A0A151ZAX0_TIELA|nr:hypothetical protein DLAC_07985 [Tieghemostelium lacteum]|eukprot:KYQ91081.1 hypothetical protein DLAC_07985 [Tieghemostelium lacteum]
MSQWNYQLKKAFRKYINRKQLYKYLYHFVFYVLVIAFIALLGLATYNSAPRKYYGKNVKFEDNTFDVRDQWKPYIDFYGNNKTSAKDYNVILDAHSHTLESDGKLSVEDNIRWHIQNGFNAMILTDHNTNRGGLEGVRIAQEKYKNEIVVIPGQEWTNCRCHLGLIGTTKVYPKIKWPTNDEISNLIKQVHLDGGLVVLNHYPWSHWSGLKQPSMEDYKGMNIDFIEVVNGNDFDYQGYQFAKENNIRVLTGTDLHLDFRVNTWSLLNVPVDSSIDTKSQVTASYLTTEKVMESLKNKSNDITFIHSAFGHKINLKEQLQLNPVYTFLLPWILVGSYFHSFYSYGRGQYSFVNGFCEGDKVSVLYGGFASFIAWCLILFVCFEIIFILSKILFKKLLKLTRKGCKKTPTSIKDTNDSKDIEDDPSKLTIDEETSSTTSSAAETISEVNYSDTKTSGTPSQ